jgi:hypothetical protein
MGKGIANVNFGTALLTFILASMLSGCVNDKKENLNVDVGSGLMEPLKL